ncbi:choice-of-anchor P family protein [Nocardia suismassiliense]|uniref:choice-of-anchor P family protein n=1 Tax=Nocardia suismassiliense TaxID=2077092 RepID=UPI000D1F09DA|nr:choice-of-anchor P family protein [Nocardia suismassiliense]
MKTASFTKRVGATVVGLAATAGVLAATAGPAAATIQHQSTAFGWYLSAHDVNHGPIGTTAYPQGPTHASLVDTHHDLVVVGGGESDSNGDGTTGASWAKAKLTELGIDLFHVHPSIDLPGGVLTIVADSLESSCRADASGTTATSSLTGAHVTINGKQTDIPASPPPNFKISVPGLIDVTFNKQTRTATGALSVQALAIESTPLFETIVQGNLDGYFASSTCGETVTVGELTGGHGH